MKAVLFFWKYTKRKIVTEKSKDHQEKVSEIINSQLTNTNERLNKFHKKLLI